MPTVARLGSGIPLVARGREMRRLRAALDCAAAGSAGAVLLSGDAGVGKSRLVDELTRLAQEQSALVLTGRCVDVGEMGLPYLPFAEAFGQVPRDAVAAVRARPALGRLLPELAIPTASERNPESGAGMVAPETGVRVAQDLGQLQLFDAVYGLLGELAEQRCVLLVVEDVHWADASTRNLLSFLLARLRAQRLLVLVSYRADDLHRTHPLRPLLTELVRLPAVERLDLAPFGAEESRAFVAALAEDTLSEPAIAQIAERSEGNAFFAEELVATCPTCTDGLPWVLVDVLLARVERLGPAAQRVIRMASVSGRWVRHSRLRAVAALDADETGREPMTDAELHDALREAVQHHVLVVDGDDVLAFRHALLHEAVYGDLLPGERVRLHAAYARHLATEQGQRGAAAALAHHSLESHALPQALAASVAAAQEARDLGAPATALRHFEQALKLWAAVPEEARPPSVDEAALYNISSQVAGTAGEPERAVAYARSAVELADRTGVPERAAEARRRLAQALFALDGREAEAAELIERAWEQVRDRPPSHTSAWVLAVRARVLRASAGIAEARECAEQAVCHARESKTISAEADALITMAVLDDMAGRADVSADRLTEAVTLAQQVGALNVELRARYNLAVNRYDQGLLDAAERVVDAAVDRASDAGLTWSAYGLELRILQIVVREARGDWDGAAAAAEPPGCRVSNTVSARLAAAGASLLVNRGRFGEAERLLGQLTADWHLDIQIVRLGAAAGAELACWQGRPQDAADLIERALQHMRRIDPDWPIAAIRLTALGIAAHADLAEQGRRNRDAEAERAAVADVAGLVAEAARSAGSRRPRSGELGPEGRAWLSRLTAEHSRVDGAGDPAAWRAAAEAFAGYGEAYQAAVCRWRLGAALIAAQRREEAAEQLSLAHEVAELLGARPLLDAVTQLARRARIAVAPGTAAPSGGPDPLTPRERAVLDLVALGRTNRQVGEELFISEKTVSVHLSRVMAKLGASRRAEAVAIAYDRGLIAPRP
jgi:DNA-binding CsgD family transcriptional regulator